MKILVLITTILTLGLADTGEGLSELISLDTVDPAVQVLAPNGGENFMNEEFIDITWSASDFSFGDAPIKIYFSEDGGVTYTDSTGFEENDGIYQWSVPDTPCFEAVVKITAIDEFGNSANDESDNTFSYHDGAQISISPSSLSFDINLENGTEETQTLTITNSGDVPLVVDIHQEIVVDIDGNIYETVQIGDQVWMSENLKVTHYNDGSEIPTGYSAGEWTNLSTGAYAVYDNDPSNAEIYGNLYNGYAVETGNLAPEGWHVPTDDEIKQLEMYLGMSQEEADGMGYRGTNEGSKLASRADLWNDGNLENNEAFGTSGFDALPGGYRFNLVGYYDGVGYGGYFWSSAENNYDNAWSRILGCNGSGIGRGYYGKRNGFSVRCLRDVDYLTIRDLDEPNYEAHRDSDFRDDWLTLSEIMLTIPPDSSADVLVTVNAEGLDYSAYADTIIFYSNDPVNGELEVSVTMSVLYPVGEIITEIMQNPSAVSDNDGEWFEIFNANSIDIDLEGWVIRDNGDDYHTISASVPVDPGQYVVLGSNGDFATNGGVNIDYEYSDITLGNSSDELILVSPYGTIIDNVAYDNGATFPDQSGASMALLDSELDNSVGSNWTVSITPYGDGDLGTPGFLNFFSDIDVSVNSLEFDTTAVGNNTSQSITIYNTGIAVLSIDSVYATGDAFQPSLTNASVDADSSLTFTVTFTPDDYGNYSETLFILSNDHDEPSVSIALSGFGFMFFPHIDISTNSLSFPNTMVGLTSSMELTIFNIGENILIVDSIYSNLPEFSPMPSEMSINVGNSAVCEITFTPQEIQGYSGQLIITSNDPDNSTLSVSLSGSGVEPDADIYVEQDTLDFGDAYEGVTSTLPLVIRNIGLEDLEIEEVEFGMGNESPFSTEFEDATVEPDSSVMVEISFYYSPERTIFEDVLSIYSNDPDESELNIFLISEIPPPDIDVSPTEYSVQLGQGESSTQTLTISNTGGEPLEVTLSIDDGSTVADIDGNVYETVQIGEQVWMKENLKVTHYNNDGDVIPTGYSNSEWANLSTGAYAVYGDNENNADTYGYLYNWYAVDDSRGVCPDDWHVPTDAEWTVLEDFITNDGYAGIEGNALKEIGYEHWNDDGNPDHEGLDIYGFTGLPGGYRYNYSGNYYSMGSYGYFWSSTESSSYDAWSRYLGYSHSEIHRSYYYEKSGFSVRCLRDLDYLTIRLSDEPNNEAHGDDNFRDEWLTLSADSLTIPPDSSYHIDVTFDATNLELGEYLTGINISSNDSDEPEIIVPVTLVVDSTSSTMEIEIDNLAGWNLVGLPLAVEDNDYQILFPDAVQNTLFSFDEIYIQDSVLVNGEGYWLRFDTTGTTTIIGNPIDELIISLNEGWNLVSGITETISVYAIVDPDSIVIENTLFGYTDAYEVSEILEPGEGYWLRAFQDGEITLTTGALAKTTTQDYSLNANTLSINGSELYFGVELSGSERLSYSLPPKPPSGAFDVRFKDGWRVVKDYGEVEVMPISETLTIAYDIMLNAGEHYNWVLTATSGEEYFLENAGEIVVPSAERFTLELKAIIPATFTLHQNFPNPFNPITTLRYDLPEDNFVMITVYDMLGRTVVQLVNTTQEAGFKSVQWDATDSMGRPVSAGVYLYQIQAGEFVQTKKMVLLK